MGPRWLGIGSQRCGTTWFTKLLVQHPRVTLSAKRHKELQLLHRPQASLEEYQGLFDGCAGEWTPSYIRDLAVPPVAAQVLDDEATVLVMVRDPVERFASAMRHYTSLAARKHGGEPRNPRLVHSDAIWGGFYATQLDEWVRHIGAERLMVFQYESVRVDPQRHVDAAWRRLGLDPVPLRHVDRPARRPPEAEWSWPAGLEDALTGVYAPEAERMVRWGVDLALWPRFASVAASGPDGEEPAAVRSLIADWPRVAERAR